MQPFNSASNNTGATSSSGSNQNQPTQKVNNASAFGFLVANQTALPNYLSCDVLESVIQSKDPMVKYFKDLYEGRSVKLLNQKTISQLSKSEPKANDYGSRIYKLATLHLNENSQSKSTSAPTSINVSHQTLDKEKFLNSIDQKKPEHGRFILELKGVNNKGQEAVRSVIMGPEFAIFSLVDKQALDKADEAIKKQSFISSFCNQFSLDQLTELFSALPFQSDQKEKIAALNLVFNSEERQAIKLSQVAEKLREKVNFPVVFTSSEQDQKKLLSQLYDLSATQFRSIDSANIINLSAEKTAQTVADEPGPSRKVTSMSPEDQKARLRTQVKSQGRTDLLNESGVGKPSLLQRERQQALFGGDSHKVEDDETAALMLALKLSQEEQNNQPCTSGTQQHTATMDIENTALQIEQSLQNGDYEMAQVLLMSIQSTQQQQNILEILAALGIDTSLLEQD